MLAAQLALRVFTVSYIMVSLVAGFIFIFLEQYGRGTSIVSLAVLYFARELSRKNESA
jgi:hypothetical protein